MGGKSPGQSPRLKAVVLCSAVVPYSVVMLCGAVYSDVVLCSVMILSCYGAV